MVFRKVQFLLVLILLGTGESVSLRAQQSPCYEFLCGGEPALLCGSDSVTYLNGCTYSQAQCKDPALFVVHPGACKKESESVVTIGTTAPELETEAVTTTETSTIPTVGEMVTNDSNCADTFCSARHSPVCANDGITYSSRCQLSKAMCRTPGLDLKHEGRCKTYENCLTRICPMREESLCGTDNKTYRNLCELSIAKCYNPSLAPQSNGPCSPGDAGSIGVMGCDIPCEDQYRPVCATNAKTYPNVCHFENARCKNNKLKIFKFEPC
ncbi:four-domain proteases inhibitor [Folsomia candida]|uniref:Serine protease inhibitor dipetalogastin n=1 Tax=Folsomia candida TaxID=158441 RepID=A0A226E4G7_FOLCA|nr:four-domain proteases inhibitor [Folsomia candida]OXA51877.1 Serine protease inhibitor dipetalogastin [Folsomia candida]